MPTLADIYSAANSFKRRLNDAAANPGASFQQMLGYANDRAANLRDLSRQAADETIAARDPFANGPANQALDETLRGAYGPVGMTVWHGSPHIFEKFDLSKMGTGEGAQAYGKGMYMAQNPEVANSYKNGLTNKNVNLWKDLEDVLPDVLKGKAVDWSDEILGGKTFSDLSTQIKEPWKRAVLQQNRKQIEEIINKQQSLGSIYKVDLPDTHIRRMLDWDEPLKNQPTPVRKLAKSLGMDMNDLGGDLLAKVGKGEEGKQVLEKAGIRGVKYLDQFSRDKQKGTRNFVVFDPNHLTILERNSEPLK